MKKIVCTILMVIVAVSVNAQNNYYDGQEIYIDNTLTFKCNVWTLSTLSGIRLENIHDTEPADGVPWAAPGIGVDEEGEIMRENFRLDPGMNVKMLDAFWESFTQAEIESMAGQHVRMILVFNANGDIVNLSIGINNTPLMKSFPPEKYAALYKKFKSTVKFDVVDTRVYYNGGALDVRMDRVITRQRLFNLETYGLPELVID